MEAEGSTNLGNCPHCTNIIFKDAVFNSEAAFSMRCPHCNKNLKVIIKTRIEIVILPVQAPDKPKKRGTDGTGIVMVMLIVYLPPLLHQIMHHADDIIDIFT
ncbi:MAG: hypothetical protein RLZZ347_21 [Candidatus Parcubacteria bacterium]